MSESIIYNYKVYCITEGKFKHTTKTTLDLVCPNVSEHTINMDSLHIIKYINIADINSDNTEIIIMDQKTIGTNAGTFTQDKWQLRDINYINHNNNNFITLNNNNTFWLQPGGYHINISVPATNVNNHRIRLYNKSLEIPIKYGSTEKSNKTYGSTTNSIINDKIISNGSCLYQIEHYCTFSKLNYGLGIASGIPGDNEIYTIIKVNTL
jgi:hypothetical protein